MTANNATIKSSSALSPGDEGPELTTLDLSKGWFERGGKRIGIEIHFTWRLPRCARNAAFPAALPL